MLNHHDDHHHHHTFTHATLNGKAIDAEPNHSEPLANGAEPSPHSPPDSPSNSPAKPILKADRLLEQVVSGTLGPLARLTGAVDVTLEHLSAWIANPENRKQINNLVTLLDAQSQLLACQYRVLAVSRLVQVISDGANHETVRRACADLLKMRLIDPYREDKRPMAALQSMQPAPSEEAILDALERIGQMESPNFELDRSKAGANPNSQEF